MRSRRPSVVSWPSLGVLTVRAVYLIHLVGGLSMAALPLTVPLWHPALTGSAWVLAIYAFSPGDVGDPGFGWFLGAAFLLWCWADRLFRAPSGYALQALPFSLRLIVLGAAACLWILRQRAVRHCFGEMRV